MRLIKTCEWAPEQYDAFQGKAQVGYLRLRHGAFTVRCPNSKGEVVFCAEPRGHGQFFDDEREHFLSLAQDAIREWMKDNPSTRSRQ